MQDRYGLGDTALCRDMLRSEHIPFNLFVPMRGRPWASDLFNGWAGCPIEHVRKIAIEWAPAPKSEYLDDNTSFDAFVEYVTTDGVPGALGVEVKYTEGAYAWGQTERARMFNAGSLYLRAHKAADLYASHALDQLRTRRLKQLWRNQLLGATMLQHPKSSIERFTSVLVYPSGNDHMTRAVSEYEQLLRPEQQSAFRAVTFEELIGELRNLITGKPLLEWVTYFEKRYLIRGE